MQIDWLQILSDEVEKAGSIQAVANQLGYARPSISLALGGKYPGGIDKLRAKVIATYCERVVCTHTGMDMSQGQCSDMRSRPLPQSDANELRHWMSCQSCPNNPEFALPKKDLCQA